MDHSKIDTSNRSRLPEWLKTRHRPSEAHTTRTVLRKYSVSTVCESARCPNRNECFSSRTATFMVLGPACTRRCRFCAVDGGLPAAVDPDEPMRIASAAGALGLSYVVITMVTRDDLTDGGAGHVAAVVKALHGASPGTKVEVLTSDFGGNSRFLEDVLRASPDLFNHNVETVPRLYARVRPGARYARSLAVLRRAAEWAPSIPVKSGLMVGLGETEAEVLTVMEDLRAAGCRIVTIGQYLQPTRRNLPVQAYVTPDRFKALEKAGCEMGFAAVFAGPLVRSSYGAGEAYRRREIC
jgi:lipoic acid synthetase